MNTSAELRRAREWAWMRGFSSLFAKESRAWWSTRRWWLNAVLWPGLAALMVVYMLYLLGPTAALIGSPVDQQAAFVLQMGLRAFFEIEGMFITIGVVILCQDLFIEERHSGVAEWLLAKPVQRRSYVLAKLFATVIPVAALAIALPAAVTYVLVSVHEGQPFPATPFIAGTAMVALHCEFYLTLTLALGTVFNSRLPILGIAMASLLGGDFIIGAVKPLMYVTPWLLPKLVLAVVTDTPVPPAMLWGPIVATGVWCAVLVSVTLVKLERTEL